MVNVPGGTFVNWNSPLAPVRVRTPEPMMKTSAASIGAWVTASVTTPRTVPVCAAAVAAPIRKDASARSTAPTRAVANRIIYFLLPWRWRW